MGCHTSGELARYSCEYAAAVDMSGLALSVFRISVVVEVGIYVRLSAADARGYNGRNVWRASQTPLSPEPHPRAPFLLQALLCCLHSGLFGLLVYLVFSAFCSGSSSFTIGSCLCSTAAEPLDRHDLHSALTSSWENHKVSPWLDMSAVAGGECLWILAIRLM